MRIKHLFLPIMLFLLCLYPKIGYGLNGYFWYMLGQDSSNQEVEELKKPLHAYMSVVTNNPELMQLVDERLANNIDKRAKNIPEQPPDQEDPRGVFATVGIVIFILLIAICIIPCIALSHVPTRASPLSPLNRQPNQKRYRNNATKARKDFGIR